MTFKENEYIGNWKRKYYITNSEELALEVAVDLS
jgi:hypothetical protein